MAGPGAVTGPILPPDSHAASPGSVNTARALTTHLGDVNLRCLTGVVMKGSRIYSINPLRPQKKHSIGSVSPREETLLEEK